MTRDTLYLLAVTIIGGGGKVDNVPTLTADKVLTNSLNIAYMVAGIIAVITVIVGAIMFTTSAGNSGSVTKGKNLVLYSVIGLVVIIAAYAITNFVLGKF